MPQHRPASAGCRMPSARRPFLSSLSPGPVVDHPDHGLQVLRRRLLQDAVAEAEYVSSATLCLGEDFGYPPGKGIASRRCGSWVEVPLNAQLIAAPLPDFPDREPPVDAQHISSDGAELFQEPGRVCAEVYRGDSFVDRVNDLLGVRENISFIV